MAKHLVQTDNRYTDIFIASRFIPTLDKENKIQWEDKEAGIAKGTTVVDSAVVYSTEHTDAGQMVVHKIWLSAPDIKSIYEAMLEVETITTGVQEDDLPF